MSVRAFRLLIGSAILLSGSGSFAGAVPDRDQPATIEAPAAEPAREIHKVLFAPIRGMIDVGLTAFVRRTVDRARADGASIIVFEMDTEGGEVDSAISICRAIDSASLIRTVVYVTHKAWSAGALISISADRIYMAPVSTIGSAAPVAISPEGGAEMLGEKYVSAIRAEFRAWAGKKGYPPNLAAAMVDKDIEVKEVEVQGKRLFLTPDDIEQERQRLGDEGKGDVRVVRTVNEKGKLLNLTSQEAVNVGFASGIAGDRAELLRQLGASDAEIEDLAPNWSEGLVRFLNHPMVSGLLLTFGLLGIYIEFKTPGVAVPGILGVVCIALLFGSKYLVGLAEATEILIFLLGLVLIAVEIFVIPGFGVVGILGIACVLGSLILASQPFVIPNPEIPWEMEDLVRSLFSVAFGLGLFVIGVFAIARFLPSTPLLRRLVLESSVGSDEGFSIVLSEEKGLTGQTGLTATPLRPAGKIRVEDKIYDATTEGDFLEKAERIVVTDTSGNRIVVKRLPRGRP